VGGDHGGGKFRMTFKILLKFSSKASISSLYQNASVEHSKVETAILKETVLDPIGEGLKNIVCGKRFIVQKQDGNLLLAQFDYSDITNDVIVICDVPTHLVVVGDLKFYVQILGRENMSVSWCIWCQRHPSDWPFLCTMENRNREDETWTIFKIKDYLDRIKTGALKEAKEKKGIVYAPVWDFIEAENFMFPQLHVEIGRVNKVVEKFYDFVEAQVEAATPEQKLARSNVIIATRRLEIVKEQLAAWRQNGPRSLMALRAERQQVNAQLRRGETIDLLILKNNLETQIDQLMDEKKLREKNVATGKKDLSSKMATLKSVTEKKSKIEKPIHTEIELLLSEYNISAAAFHGGKLNGVDCRRFMHHASSIFSDVLTLLLQSENLDRCTDVVIQNETELHRDVAIVLDTICSRLRKKNGRGNARRF
jgi:hypothetical protein